MIICDIVECNQRSAFCSSSLYQEYYLCCPCKDCIVRTICVTRCDPRTSIVGKLLSVNLEGITYQQLPGVDYDRKMRVM